jgi:hypothetical protein
VPKEREILIDAIPAPGEPLQVKIHEDNQRLIDEELAERANRLRARLKPAQLRQLRNRYKKLHKHLNRAKYNPLVAERWVVWQEFQTLLNDLKHIRIKKKRAEMQQQLERLRARGKELNAAIEKLQPVVDLFIRVNQRLKAHKELLEWEQKDKEDRKQFRKEAYTWKAQIEAVFRQSARLHHKGDDKRGKQFIKIPKIDRIIFKEDRVLFHIRTTVQSLIERFAGRWHSALPYNVDMEDLKSDETLENLSAGCRRIVTVEYSNSGTSFFYAISRLDSADGIPNKIPYNKVIDWYPVAAHAKTPWAAGVTKDRKAHYYDFESQPHILIAGSTQSGKSNHVNQMIATLVTMNSPAELRLLLVDLKGGIEFTHWSGLQHQLRPMVKHASEVLGALQYLRSVMEQRLARFEKIKAKNLASYNAKAQHKIPRIICVIDEMATLLGLDKLTSDIHTELRVLSSQGRAVGVHLVLCTQHSSVDVLPGWVKTNMVLRISGKMPSHQASMVILDSVSAATLPNIPGRLVFSVGRYEVIAQSPFISDGEIERAVTLSQAFPAPENSEFATDEDVEDIEEASDESTDELRYQLIEMALKRFGGVLSANKIHEVLGNEVIRLRELREIVATIIEDAKEGIAHNGRMLQITRNGKAYILTEKVMEHPMEPETDEDTGKFVPFHRSIVPSEEPVPA